MRDIGTPHSRRYLIAGAIIAVGLAAMIPTSIAIAGPLEDQLARTRAKERTVKSQLGRISEREEFMLGQLDAVNLRINALDVPIAELTTGINDLSSRIAHRQERIDMLRIEYVQQQRDIKRIDAELDIANERLAARLVLVYKNGGRENAAWLTGVRTLGEAIDRQDYVAQVTQREDQIVDSIDKLERKIRIKRARNHDLRRDMRTEIADIAGDRDRIEADKRVLVGKQDALEAVENERSGILRNLRSQKQKLGDEMDDLASDSKALREAIESGSTNFSGLVPGVSSAGLMWPVSGPVVSRFGMRWGRMHEGWDIAVPAGTPIHAAQSGVVTYAGWMSGYGNMVIVQHAGSLSTGYAHQSRIGTSVGQVVGQGQVIGFVGCTGHCFGDHVHFETRINGSAVNPDSYL